MNVLEWIYYTGLRCDQALTQSVRLPRPVISVGNIAVGGRSKTPFVIDLCKLLQQENYEPVVLTRGYGRGSSGSFSGVLRTQQNGGGDARKGPEDLAAVFGDEPCEIHLLTGVTVLVSANRARAAEKFLRSQRNSSKIIFILDDGFQHWKLERDFDIVLIRPQDREARLLPLGRLREAASALERADCVFEDGINLHKKTQLPEALPPDEKICVLTTRAGSQSAYLAEIQQTHKRSILRALPDHAPAAAILRELRSLSQGLHVLLGWKEAMKIFSWTELLTLRQTRHLQVQKATRELNFWIAESALEYDRNGLLEQIRASLIKQRPAL